MLKGSRKYIVIKHVQYLILLARNLQQLSQIASLKNEQNWQIENLLQFISL